MKLKRWRISRAFVIAVAAIAVACNMENSSRQHKENYDSLLLEIKFGMEQQAFFNYCKEMNSKKIFVHGAGNTSVEYRIENGFSHSVIMRFYPSFYEEKIYEMPITYHFEVWAPWNKQYWSDVLLEQIYELYKKKYGDGFKVINHPVQGKIYSKIDGFRRINLFIRDDQFVQAVFTDVNVENKIKKEEDKK